MTKVFGGEIRKNLKKMSDNLIDTCNEMVKANKETAKQLNENTKAIRSMRRTLKQLKEKL